MKGSAEALLKIRQQFPTLSQTVHGNPLVYLDNAATTQKPQCVIDAVTHYYTHANANVHRASHALSAEATHRFEQARETVASYINARSSKEIIWTRGATEAINLVANSLGSGFRSGDEIIVSTMEHHANIVPWQMLVERSGLTLKVIPLTKDGDLDLDAFAQLLSERTKLVAITHVSNALGTINPVSDIIQKAKSVGALTLVDGAQALPHFKIDVQAMNADFYVFSGHKLYSPTGIGVLYGKQALLESMPPWQGGGEMIHKVSFDGTTYNELPFKFEAGTPNISGAIALGEAINWLNSLDAKIIADHEHHLFQHAFEGCQQIKGFQRVGNPNSCVSLLSFTLADQHQQDIGLLLDRSGIAVRTGHHCAMPLMQQLGLPGTTRASFAIYNTEDEVSTFVTALDEITRPVQVKSAPLNESQLLKRLLVCKGWNERYREIMLAGKRFEGIAPQFKTDKNLVKGCESQTWLLAKIDEDSSIKFSADSDARIIRGLLVLLLEIFNKKTPEQILQIDLNKIFSELDLQKHLSPSRGNGLRAVADKIYQIARQHMSAQENLEKE